MTQNLYVIVQIEYQITFTIKVFLTKKINRYSSPVSVVALTLIPNLGLKRERGTAS